MLIICPVLNEENGIAATIDSLRNQSCQHFDVIFFDSGSNDASVSIITASALPNSRLVEFEENLGVSRNWARALKSSLAAGSHTRFMFLGGDDQINKDFVLSVKALCLNYSGKSMQLIPEFYGVKDGVWDDQTFIVPSFFSVSGLLSDWKAVHACYGVFDRDFMVKKYLPTLENGSTNFDWWVSYLCLSKTYRVSNELKYGKYLKSMDYLSSYYTGGTQSKFQEGLFFWSKILEPYRTFRSLVRGGSKILGDLPGTQRFKLMTQILFGRYSYAIKKFFSRIR
jgi:glycosyltransferase involved in cell wall biosynthesis